MENENFKEKDNINEEITEEFVDVQEEVNDIAEDAVVETTEEMPDAVEENENKPNKKKVIIGVAIAIAAIVVAIVVYCACIVNGVGGKSIVNSESFFKNEQHMDVKFENPVMVLCDKIVLGSKDATVFKINDKPVSKNIFMYYLNYATSDYVSYIMNEKLQPQMNSLKTEEQINEAVKKIVAEIDWKAPMDENSDLSIAESLRAEALGSRLVPMFALINEGELKGLSLSDEELKQINDSIAQLKAQYGTEYEAFMTANGFEDEATYIEIMKAAVLADKVAADFEEDMSKYIDSEKLNSYVQNNNSTVTVKHILIKPEEGAEDKAAAMAVAKTTAEDVLKRAKAGEDFDKLIEIYNNDPGQGKEGYTFAKDGSMVKEFEDASFALKEGEISGIVETTYGYHIIKRIKKNPDLNDYLNYLADNAKVRIKRSVYENSTVTSDDILRIIGIN